MGVCGSSQICQSKENVKSASNMQQKQKSLSAKREDVFDHDKRKYRLEDTKIVSSPSSQSKSLSSGDIISPPNPSAQTKSNISSMKLRNISTNSTAEFIESDSNDDGEDIPKCGKLPTQPHPMPNKARISRNLSSTPSVGLGDIVKTKPDITGIKSRKSAKHCYVALAEEEHDEIDPNDEEEEEPEPQQDEEKEPSQEKKDNDENRDNNQPLKQLKDRKSSNNTNKNKKTNTNATPTETNDGNETSNPVTPLPFTVTKSKSNPRSPFGRDSTNGSPKFVRMKHSGRRRASSQDIMTAAEHALMEDSTNNAEDYAGLITPLTTPYNGNNGRATSPFNKIPMMKSISDDRTDDERLDIASPNGAYPIDFQDNHPSATKGSVTASSITITKPIHNKALSLDSLNINQDPTGRMHRELGARRNAGGNSMMTGPLSNFSINSTHSQSSLTHTLDTNNRNHHSTNFNGNDNININNFYTTTREPNLSISAINPSLLGVNGAGSQFPRVSSTSSDFAHLIEHGYRKESNDNSDYIKWRFSVDGIVGSSQGNLPTYNSLSSIPIDRVSSRDHDQSLTDL